MMKNSLLIMTLIALLASCSKGRVEKADIQTAKDSVSYLIGLDFGQNTSSQMGTFPGGMNQEEFADAFITSFKGDSVKIKVDNSRSYIMEYVQAAQAAETDSTIEAPSNKDSVSYIIGCDYGTGIAQQLETFPGGMNKVAFLEAFVTGFDGDSARIAVDDARNYIMEYVQKAQEEEQAKAAEEAKEANKETIEKAEAFLAENAKKEGVVTTESGLQYKVEKSGNGAKPTASSRVKVHYHGTLIDGKVFDSSVERNSPATFGVTQVIKGWTEALQLMSVGDKWTLYIPSELAYGATGAGADIPPFAALIFEVELLEILN